MFTRVGRLTTFGAQAITNCPFRREKTYQAPRVTTAKNEYQIFNFAQSFSESTTRPRTFSSGDDPFIGVMMDEEHEVTKELELLDLDSWNDKKSLVAPSEALRKPPDILEESQGLEDMFWQGSTSLEPPGIKLEQDIEQASKMVDWDAWNRYLGEDDEKKEYLNYFGSSSKLEGETVKIEQMERKIEIPVVPKREEMEEYKPQICVTHLQNPSPPTITPFFHQSTRFSSGPLFYIPPKKMKKEENYVKEVVYPLKLRSRRSREVVSPVRYLDEVSEQNWISESEEDFDEDEEKPRFKKRGVVMKPPADEETDRRRALNRVAAVRYREKKRHEKMMRKQEHQVVLQRNRILKQQERQLKKEIAEMRKKLKAVGAI